MTDSREPSYYEIALTNRQVMTVFVILLVCVVAAFFSGVWVGRREGAPAGERMAGNPGAAAPIQEEGEPLRELDFFDEEEPAPAVQEPTPPPATAAEQSQPDAGDAVRSAPPPAAAEGDLVVQVFSSNDRGQAERVVDRLRAAGFAALLSPVEVRDQTMYRVRIGPFGERDEAERVAGRVRKDFKLDTWITSG